MTYNTFWEVTKDGETYECEVSFEASNSSLTEISINHVVLVGKELDIDPELFQSKLTSDEETILYKELNDYATDYDRYLIEDTTT